MTTAATSIRRIQPLLWRPRRRRWALDNCRFSSSRYASTSNDVATESFRWLDLSGSGLSMLERLTLEEALLQETRDNWILVGTHHVWPPKHIAVPPQTNSNDKDATKNPTKGIQQKVLPNYITGGHPNPDGMIVMGIGGKAEQLLNSSNVIRDQLLVVKRFSGGGTVVMDGDAIWTTLIAGRKRDEKAPADMPCKPFPRDIMKWTAEAVFGPTFDKLREHYCPINNGSFSNPPTFSLREDDYVLALGEHEEVRKMGGNAQAIKGRQGWLHHTSFLWDYKESNMEGYLKLPAKRPEYRSDRSHGDFLVKLSQHYGDDPSVFVEALKKASEESLGLVETNWQAVYEEVFGGSDSDMHQVWLENRTRIQHDL